MNIEIVEKKENPLLDREEIKFTVSYDGEATPTRLTIQSKLAAMVNADAERTVIRKISGRFGMNQSNGLAFVYPDVATRDRIESKHIIKRNTKGGDDSE